MRQEAGDWVALAHATAVWALAKLGDLDTAAKLRQDPHPRVRREAERALRSDECLTEHSNCGIMPANPVT